jgi:tRNA threonylcarbamoyladenosine biosynthesis protein TsaE
MGAGKTTFIKQLAKELELWKRQPNLSLVNEYQTNDNQIVYHFDFYRNETEAIWEWMNICILETGALSRAENIPNLIPDSHSIIYLKELPGGKRIRIKLNYYL